jgi:hypothetical protein
MRWQYVLVYHSVSLPRGIALLVVIDSFDASYTCCVTFFVNSTTLNGDAGLETLPMFPLVFLNSRLRSHRNLMIACLLVGSCVLSKHDGVQVAASLLH